MLEDGGVVRDQRRSRQAGLVVGGFVQRRGKSDHWDVSRRAVSAQPDRILAAVLQRRVHAITQEMATVLMRSSRSPIFNEIGDLVTVVFDADGRTLAQTEYASIIANGAGPPLPIGRAHV